jgi:hypothetical protein
MERLACGGFLTLGLNPHSSHETEARRMGHPEIQLPAFGRCRRVSHPPCVTVTDPAITGKANSQGISNGGCPLAPKKKHLSV